MKLLHSIISYLIIFLPIGCMVEASQTQSTHKVTGAVTWETRSNGVTFSLTQILPEQARAFYVNRGFTLEQIEPYVTSCLYMAVIRNDNAPGVIHFTIQNWSVLNNSKSKPPLKTESWLKRLSKSGAIKSALIAFRWAQFPAEHDYEPGGDWNQGMLTMGLATETKFDITARWDINNKNYQGVLRNVQCAR